MAVVGYSQSVVTLVAQVDRVKLIGDGVSFVGSGKTLTDHALSLVAGGDCRVFNVVSRDPVCATSIAEAGADSKVRLSLGPATAPLEQASAQAAFEADADISPPVPGRSADGE